MKILITTDLFTVKTNGVVTSVTNLFNELLSRGHDVRLLTLSDDGTSRREGPVYYIRSFSLEHIYPGVRGTVSFKDPYLRDLIDWKPDIIHSQCEFFTFRFARSIAKYAGCPIVHTYHTMYEDYVGYLTHSPYLGKALVRVCSRRWLKDLGRVIAPSYKTRSLLEQYGLENVSVIPTGISLEQHFQRVSFEELESLRSRFHIADEAFVLLSLGRLGAEKGTASLLKALAPLIQSFPDIVLVLVGDGPDRAALEQLAAELCISKNVIFTGAVDPQQVQKYYQMAHVFVSASTSETQGLVYIEAAANGLPLVCRKDPCLRGLLQDGVNGFSFLSEEELRSAVLQLRRDAGFRRFAGGKSREASMKFDQKEFADRVEALYRQVCGMKSK